MQGKWKTELWIVGLISVLMVAAGAAAQSRGGEPLGACCFPDGDCDVISENQCIVSGGEWQGSETSCGKPDPNRGNGTIICELVPPPNDECVDAIEIMSFNLPVSGVLQTATSDDVPNCVPFRGLSPNGVWYSVIGNGSVLQAELCALLVPTNGPVELEGLIQVYCGDCTDLNCVAGTFGELDPCVDRGGLSTTWCSEPGREYLILVAMEGSVARGVPDDYIFQVNDLGQTCEAEPCGLPNDDCEDAILLTTSDGFVPGTSAGATPDFNVPTNCFADDDIEQGGGPTGVWYKVIGTGNVMSIDVCTDDFLGGGKGGQGAAVGIFCGNCSSLQCIEGRFIELQPCIVTNDSSSSSGVEWCSEEGREYFVFVEVFDDLRGAPESFLISVNDLGFDSCEPLPCGGAADFCEDAQLVCPGEIYFGNTFDATSDYLDHGAPFDSIFFCGMFFGLYDVWYKYEPALPGLLFVHVEGPPTEYVFGVYDQCPGLPWDLLDCNIARHHGVIVLHVQPEQTYYIRIAGYGTSRGEFQLDLVGPPCENGIGQLHAD